MAVVWNLKKIISIISRFIGKKWSYKTLSDSWEKFLGGTEKSFIRGGLRPEVQPLTLLYTIFFRKGTPFVYLLSEKAPLWYTL